MSLNPDQITSATLEGWWSGDTVLGLSDGDPTSTAPDQSAFGRDFTQTGSERPIWEDNELNGKPILRFNGSSQYMTAGDLAIWDTVFHSSGAKYTVFAVAKNNQTDAVDGCILSKADDPTELGHVFQSEFAAAGNKRIRHIAQNKTGSNILRQAGGTNIHGTFAIMAWTFDDDASPDDDKQEMWINNIKETLSSQASGAGTGAANTARLLLGAQEAGNICLFEGDIAEWFIHSGKLSDTEIGGLSCGLGTKYDIEVASLPTQGAMATVFAGG